MANGHKHECIGALIRAGISHDDAIALRRISMTLHRWHELECGDGNDYASWTITRGHKTVNMVDGKKVRGFVHHDNGKPFLERHIHTEITARYEPIADREAGAKRRLAAIMTRYPSLRAYIQTDPRGSALYILRPGDVPEGEDTSAYYSRGIAVYK